MADFSIEFEENDTIFEFFDEYMNRLKINTFIDGKLFLDGNFAFFHIRPLVFPFYILGIFIWVIGMVLGGFGWGVFFAGLVPFSSIIFYMPIFYYIMLRIGLSKKKYKGKIKLL